MKELKIDLSGYTGKVRELVSKAVQEKAFGLGYAWNGTDKTVMYTDAQWLFPEGDGLLRYGRFDENYSNQLISVDDFLALTTAKEEPEFKPFDKVLVRNSDGDAWRANFFSHIAENGIFACVSFCWIQCIPYEGNEHRLGKTE